MKLSGTEGYKRVGFLLVRAGELSGIIWREKKKKEGNRGTFSAAATFHDQVEKGGEANWGSVNQMSTGTKA